MVYDKWGEVDVRKELIDATIVNLTQKMSKMKQAVRISSTGAWRNYFFRESSDELTGGLNRTVRGIPRGASFPQASASFEKVRTDIEKYGLQDAIAWEDIISGEVDIRDRTLFKLSEGVTQAVDTQIYTGLSDDTSIQSFSITSGYEWDTASAAIFDDLERAEQLIGTENYPTSNLMVFVSLRDKRSVMKFLFDNGAQIPSIADQKINNGVVGTLGNKTFVVSDVVTASESLVVVPKVCATWKELVPLTTDVTETPLKDVTITVAEMGVLQVHNPKSIVLIKNTQSASA